MSDIKMIDKYRIVKVVGEGGMGKVYRAVHPTLKKDIIIKRLSISSKKIISERFRREAQIMMDFHHESIVSVYDHFKHGACYYIAMEFVDGISLDDLIERRKTIPPLAATLIFREICKGLKYAHDKGVIHRDIKPSNVLISKAGEVKLFDFGIAALEDDEGEKELTKTGIMMGTPSYMSPEQLTDAKRVDKRSDIYSMGVLFYQMLTGRKAFPGNFSADTIRKISKGIYEKPKKLVPGLPRFFTRLIKKTMNPRPKRRYRDLEPVIHKLSRHLGKYKTQDDLHRAITCFLKEQPGKASAFEKIPRSKAVKRAFVIAGTVAVLLGVAVAFFAHYTPLPGIFWELVGSRGTGSLEIQVIVPDTYYKPPSDIYAKARLIRRRENVGNVKDDVYEFRLQPLPGIIRVVNSLGQKEEKKPEFLTTTTLYLPSGTYDLELAVEDRKYSAAFFLNPLAIQKHIPDSPDKKKMITYTLPAGYGKKIPVTHSVRDSVTKYPVLQGLKIYYFYYSYWADWQYAKGVLEGGIKHRLRYEAPSYQPREIEVTVDNELESLALQIELERYLGKVVLSSNTDELEILVDNSREYYTGGLEKSFAPLGRTLKGDREFLFPEGDYVITLKKDDKIVNNFPLSLTAGAYVRLNVSYSAQEKRINITR